MLPNDDAALFTALKRGIRRLVIDRGQDLILCCTVTHPARHDGSQLGAVLDSANTDSGVGADTA